MGKIGDLYVRLGLKNQEFKKGLDESVKKTETSGSKMKKSWKAIAGGIAVAAGAVRAFANAFSKISEFEQANANLSTILGVSVENMKDLTESAKALGRTTEYTASQVTQLQTELAKLGFSGGEIKDMQKSILGFATAVGTDLASAASLTGSTLRGFGLTAKDTEDVLGALAVSTNKSALSFSTLQSGLSIVMPVANAFGFSVKDTVALLGTLTNAGFDASSAATATRNIILYLSDSNSKLNKLLGKQVKTLPELVKALQDVKSKGVDLNTTLEATDKRAVAAFNALLDGASSTLELRDALEDTSGELQRISEERLNTVSGSIKKLQSAWEGFVLSMSNSKGAVKGVLDILTRLVTLGTFAFFRDARVSSFKDEIAANVEKVGPQGAQGYLDNLGENLANQKNRHGLGKLWRRMSTNYASNGAYTDELRQAYMEYLLEMQNAAIEQMNDSITPPSFTPDTPQADLEGEAEKEKKKKQKEAYEKSVESVKKSLLKGSGEIQKYTAKLQADSFKTTEEQFRKLNEEFDEAIAQEFEDGFEEALNGIQGDFNGFDTFGAYKNFLDDMVDVTEQANQRIRDAIVYGISDSIQTLADGIVGIEKLDAAGVFSALLSPMADACITIGELIMATGLAEIAFKNSLTNPYAAVAAGAALVGIGALAKSGIAKALNSSGTGSASSTSSAGTGSSGTSTDYSGELTIYVKGEIKGDAIAISGQKAVNKWNR